MKRKILVVALIAALVLCFAPTSSFAKSAKKAKKELKEVQKQKDDVSDELDEMHHKIEEKTATLKKINKTISKMKVQLNQTEKDLTKTKTKIDKRQDGLNQRLRTMYKSGSVGYMDVILGSNSVEELVTNVDLVQKIYSNDQTILTELKAQKTEIEQMEKKLKAEKASLSAEKVEQKNTKDELGKEQKKLQKRLTALEEQEKKLQQIIAEAVANGDISYAGGKWAFPLKSSYTLTSHYGESRSYESHPGIDLAVPTGTPIYAAQSGKVVTSGTYGGYGLAVVIYHGGGLTSVYGHNSQLLVNAGEYVKKGQKIALAGSTGWSTGSHLHFEVRNASGSPISPQPYIGIS